jgi:hypothetical protein
MTHEECVKKACQVLRRRVRYDGASLRLPTTPFPGDDTPAIREATKLFVETWVVTLLDCMESGDMTRIREYYEFERGHEMSNDQGERQPPGEAHTTKGTP